MFLDTHLNIKAHNDADLLTSEWVQQGSNEYTVTYPGPNSVRHATFSTMLHWVSHYSFGYVDLAASGRMGLQPRPRPQRVGAGAPAYFGAVSGSASTSTVSIQRRRECQPCIPAMLWM